jgi:hypothetical protein
MKTQSENAASQPSAGSEANGRRAPGNPGGPENPLARKAAALRRALVEAVTEEDVREIAKVLIEKAKEGSTAAIKLIFQYAIGKPSAENDPDRVDLDGWQPPSCAAEAQPAATASRAAAPASSFPSGLVDRLALAGLGAEHVSILGGNPPTPNGKNGGPGRRDG